MKRPWKLVYSNTGPIRNARDEKPDEDTRCRSYATKEAAETAARAEVGTMRSAIIWRDDQKGYERLWLNRHPLGGIWSTYHAPDEIVTVVESQTHPLFGTYFDCVDHTWWATGCDGHLLLVAKERGRQCGRCGRLLGDTVHIAEKGYRQEAMRFPVCDECGWTISTEWKEFVAAEEAWWDTNEEKPWGERDHRSRPDRPWKWIAWDWSEKLHECEGCRRKVYGSVTKKPYYRLPRIFCSHRCQKRVWNRKGPTVITCTVCGDKYEGRADARYCSNACRQAAYRARIASGK